MPAFRLAAAALALAVLLGAAQAAQANLVYVKDVTAAKRPSSVWLARDDGTGAIKLGEGTLPRISPDGRSVAYVRTRSDGKQELLLATAPGGDSRRLTTSSRVESVHFSPDGQLLAAEVGGRRLSVFETATGRSGTVARGYIKGLSFSPDSTRIAFGRGVNATASGASDIYTVSTVGADLDRLTDDGRSLLPVWGPQRIAMVKQKGRSSGPSAVPAYDIWVMSSTGRRVRRVTRTKVPTLVSGLLPLEWSADGRRLLGQYVGQDVQVGFTVNPFTGRTRALSRNPERGKVAFGLSGDGSSILAMTGGPDPAQRHNIVSAPYDGGASTLLVRNAAYPDWSR